MSWYHVIPLLGLLPLAGAAARRFMGGWGGKHERALQLASVGLMTGLATAFGIYGTGTGLYVGSLMVLVATVAAAAAASTGDGDGTDLGEWDKPEPDKPFWEFAVGVIDNTIPFAERRERDYKVLLWSGGAQTAAAGVFIAACGRPFLGALVLASGMLKAPAYALAYKVPSRLRNFYQGRELGEAFWGATLGLTAAFVAAYVYA